MRRLFLFLFLIALSLPLKAQGVVRYVTFFPVPYASHQTVKVQNMGTKTGKAYLNARNDSNTTVSGVMFVGSSEKKINPVFDGNLDLNSDSATNLTNLVSGTSTATITDYGEAVFDVNATTGVIIENIDVAPREVFTSGVVDIADAASSKYGAFSLSGLFCNSEGNENCCTKGVEWMPLRLSGSQECNYYLTCGGGNSDLTGCNNLEDDWCYGAWYQNACYQESPYNCSNVNTSENTESFAPDGSNDGWTYTCLCPNRDTVTLRQYQWMNNPTEVIQACADKQVPFFDVTRTVDLEPGISESSCMGQHYVDLCSNAIPSSLPKCATRKSCNTRDDLEVEPALSGTNFDCYEKIVSSQVSYSDNVCKCTIVYTWYACDYGNI